MIQVTMMIAGTVMVVVAFLFALLNMTVFVKGNFGEGEPFKLFCNSKNNFGTMFTSHMICMGGVFIGSILAFAGLVWFVIGKIWP